MRTIEDHSPGADGLTKITFTLEPSNWHTHAMESIWARPEGEDQLRLGNIPFYVYGVGYGDVVRTVIEGGQRFFHGVYGRGGHD